MVMIRFLIFMSNLTFWQISIFRHFLSNIYVKNGICLNMFSRKCQVQNDRTNQQKISCFGQKLDFMLFLTIKTLIFKLWPLFRFLCLINSFYRRYVSCVSITYPIYPIYPIHPIRPIYLIYCLTIVRYFALFLSISAKFGTTEGSLRNTYKVCDICRLMLYLWLLQTQVDWAIGRRRITFLC